MELTQTLKRFVTVNQERTVQFQRTLCIYAA